MRAAAGPRPGHLLLVVVGLLCAPPARAQQLAGETLDVRHGLSNNEVEDIYQDRAGYLWIATWEGLNRFDGRRFERFDPEHGLPPRVLNAVTEDADGTLWVATNGSGLARLMDGPSPRFELTSLELDRHADFVNDVVFDQTGRVWCATDSGLAVGERVGSAPFRFKRVRAYRATPRFTPLTRDASGRVWAGMGPDLVAIDGTAGGVPALDVHPTPSEESIVDIVAAAQGSTVTVVTTRAVFEFDARAPEPWRRLNGTPPEGTSFYAATRAFGALWVGAEGRVLEIGGDGVNNWRIGRGLRPPVSALHSDREGNLWIGTTQGLYRVPPWRIVEFTSADGLPSSAIVRLLAEPTGRVFASTTDAGLIELGDDGPKAVAGIDARPFRQLGDRVVVTRDGRWFAASADGIHRLRLDPTEARMRADTQPLVRLASPERLQLDAAGRLWVRLSDRSLAFTVSGDRLQSEATESLPRPLAPPFMTVASTPGNNVWIGDMTTLTRRTHGVLQQFDTTTGLLETRPRSTLLDSRGWLWIGMRYRGLGWTTEPDAAQPRFESLTTRGGLSSDIVSCLAEGKDGLVYVGTGRGVDRLAPATKRIEAVGPASVLSGAWVRSCVTDHAGRVWASTVYGVARIDGLMREVGPSVVPIYFARIEVDGAALSVPAPGRGEPGTVELPPGAGSLQIRFSSPALRPEERRSYEYRMGGLDDAWREADESRTVEYGRVPAGRYEFEVRAVAPGTRAVLARATVAVTALSPVWSRPWFLALAAVILAVVAFAAHRFRLHRVLELERIRRQVALDLHDDIGSGLAQIAILSEVAKRDDARAQTLADDVARLSRRLRESMADIVWAVDPRFDTLEDVAARVRETAFGLFDVQGIALTMNVSPTAELRSVRLDAHARRHLLLIAKELTTNAARHSDATAVDVSLMVEHGRVVLVLADNGRGFDPDTRRASGNGLRSLAHRIAALKGTMDIRSSSAGTHVRITLPQRHGD